MNEIGARVFDSHGPEAETSERTKDKTEDGDKQSELVT